jgi:deferrochelatase/peroxidase EfeB
MLHAAAGRHRCLTILCPVDRGNLEAARAAIEALGNPAVTAIRSVMDPLTLEQAGVGVHFASITVVPAGDRGHLVFELTGDGDRDALLSIIAKQLGPWVDPIFALALDRGRQPLVEYWKAHDVRVGQGLFDNPGLVFLGMPGLGAAQIVRQHALASTITEWLHDDGSRGSALSKLEAIRERVARDSTWTWALTREPSIMIAPGRTIWDAVPPMLTSFIATFLWPLALIPFAVLAVAWAAGAPPTSIMRVGAIVVAACVLGALVLAAVLVLGYLSLRRDERHAPIDDGMPERRVAMAVSDRENHTAQNHLAMVSRLKPTLLRRLLLHVVFWTIGQLASRYYRPGCLRSLGTVHAARWVLVPRTRDLLFLASYSGSWEGYLEDFVAKAADGLTAIWSNTEGFPRTVNLLQQGAADGPRFKRWVRLRQVPTGFWYSAYPDLTMARIRTNLAIRHGLATIRTEVEAADWIALFGSQPRPRNDLDVGQVQSLAFGGLGFLRFSSAIGFRLSEDRRASQRWLADVLPHVAFGDGRKHQAGAVIVALASTALARLGLPAESVDTFPQAFLDGMTAPCRSRLLGDEGRDTPSAWWWGGPDAPVDGLLLVYAPSEETHEALERRIRDSVDRHGHAVVVHVPLAALPARDAPEAERDRAKREPFGFVDGISQPAIRGTYKALRGTDAMHIVEAGELILGYPDNTGRVPPGPTLPAACDPRRTLAVAGVDGWSGWGADGPRDVGLNGTFLAVRHLEQDPERFAAVCAGAADTIRDRFPEWLGVTEEFVAAKLVGRWKDGAPLVRHPYQSPPASHRPAEPENDFQFGAEDPQGLRCPFGAHIRRVNPRESFEPGSQEQIAIVNRHRILRVGRFYRVSPGQRPGIFFMCLNADLARQFEFVQQSWIQSPSFHGLHHERDPLVGRHADGAIFTIPTRDGPVAVRGISDFVRTRGGGYFFVPGRALLEYLAASPESPRPSNQAAANAGVPTS